MAIRLYRAYSPGTRSRSSLYFDDLAKNKPERSLTFGKKRCSGRNNRGVITIRHRGGGHKRRYRSIDFTRNKHGIIGTVKTIEYDPNLPSKSFPSKSYENSRSISATFCPRSPAVKIFK